MHGLVSCILIRNLKHGVTLIGGIKKRVVSDSDSVLVCVGLWNGGDLGSCSVFEKRRIPERTWNIIGPEPEEHAVPFE